MGSDSKTLTITSSKIVNDKMSLNKQPSPHSRHSKLTKEEEILLQDFSRNVSTKSSALFYGNGFIITAIPLWVYWRIYPVEPFIPLLLSLFVLLTLPATFLMTYAYKNVKFVLKHKIAQLREEAITKEVNALGTTHVQTTPVLEEQNTPAGPNNTTLAAAINARKAISKKDRDERILWKKNEVSDYEATTYSIFYNNALFLLAFLVCCCFFFAKFQGAINYGLSLLLASGFTALLSTGA